ncbi:MULTISPECIES: hypothetical protein [Enterobacter cloacae complex]|uniref:hypothetical protein n=1 Tax=Enterobacter cloacae complex TaxID=354276 RepID=UPI0007981565|nr:MULTISPECIES: hypothetical protein [Enterobacter cloacae complex]CZZ05901.1 Uncharacterised protein [Enterobacter hormaechei]
MSTITKEQLRERARQKVKSLELAVTQTAFADSRAELEEELELARIALASLEAEPVCVIDQSNLDYLKSGSDADVWPASRAEMGDVLLYRSATPAPVSVPAAMEMDDDFDSAFEHGKAVGWNAYRAAMLQGADRPQNEPQNIPENIPATQFKPVADLYGLTSPTGGETSFTFDAVEARDFIDGGWSCQEYVTLERYQETLFQGAEPVSLRDGIAAIRNLGPIDAEKIQAERDALNSPVIPDGWALVPIDPTEDMIVNGFESEPDESFSDEKEWEAYDAMSGCQQAAHRAKLCWAAMISAAPKPDVR